MTISQMIEAVEHAEGMVGDDRPAARSSAICASVVLVVDELQFELADRRRPEAFARHRMGAVLLVEPLEIGLAGQPLDDADEEAASAADRRDRRRRRYRCRRSNSAMADILSWRARAGQHAPSSLQSRLDVRVTACPSCPQLSRRTSGADLRIACGVIAACRRFTA